MEQTLDNTLPLSQSDSIALLYGKPLDKVPAGLYIPPDALKVFLESFEGPLDLLLWLIQKQKFDVMDIPMATLTEQYMQYVELIRKNNLDLAGDYLVMAAHLMAIKSQLLLPLRKADTGEEVEDPKAELMRRLIEYQKMKLAAQELDRLPISGRDFSPVDVSKPESAPDLPDVSLDELAARLALRHGPDQAAGAAYCDPRGTFCPRTYVLHSETASDEVLRGIHGCLRKHTDLCPRSCQLSRDP